VTALRRAYAHDVYVSYYHGRSKARAGRSGEADLPVNSAAIDLIERWMLKIPELLAAIGFTAPLFYVSTRNDELNEPQREADRAAIDSAALMLVIATPDYAECAVCMDEFKRFGELVRSGNRSVQQLLICKLLPVDLSDIYALQQTILYDRFIRIVPDDPAAVLRIQTLVANDVNTRLQQIERSLDAAEAVAPVPATPGLPDQIYLWQSGDGQFWASIRAQLDGDPLFVNPDAMETPGQMAGLSRKERRERRQTLIDNSIGMVLLRADATEDLSGLRAEAVRDMKDLEKQLPCVLIDRLDPPFIWSTSFFQPTRVASSDPALKAKVLKALRR
jgi:hypothetical protein